MQKVVMVIMLFTAVLLVSTSSGASYPPGVMYASLLNNVNLQSEKALFQIGNQMQGVFLPDGAKGKVVLKKGDGTELYRYNWKEQKLKPPYALFEFTSAKIDVKTGEETYDHAKLTETGNYALDFYIDEQKFYTFPFSVSKLDPPDPFAGGPLYFLDGDWSDWGYLFYPDADPEKQLLWKMWFRNKSFTKHLDFKARLEIVRDTGGKVIATGPENRTLSPRREWDRIEYYLTHPMVKTSGGRIFYAKELLAVDGAYTLKVLMDNKLYGSWKFRVADGKLLPAGRTERGKADPMTFVEGGRDAFWYERAK